MAEGNHKPDQGNGAEVVRRGAAAARTAGEAVRQAPKTGAEVIGKADAVAEESSRAGEALVAEVARSTVGATQQAMASNMAAMQQGGAEVLRKTADMTGRGSTAVADDAQRTARSLWAGGQDMWRMLPGQGLMPGSLPEMPQAFAGIFNDMVRTNLRIGQELFRLANPVAMIELQQRMVRGYLEAIVAGQAMLLGAARGTAEDARRQADAPREPAPQGRRAD